MYEKNYWSRRIGRRSMLSGASAAAAGAAALVAVGCGDDDADGAKPASPSVAASAAAVSPSAAANQPKKGGTLTLQNVGRFTNTFDTQVSVGDSNGFWALLSNLMIYPHPKTIEPLQGGLVESWEQVDPNTVTFKVRQGVTFHTKKLTNGRALVAKDIAFNLERITGKYDPNRVALFNRRSSLAGLDRAEAVDDRTVKITFSTPNALFLSGVADYRNGLLAPEIVEKDPDFKNVAEFTGTGPFMIDKWDDATFTGRYVANPAYWEKGLPYLESIQEVLLPDPASVTAAFISGKTDLMSAALETDRQTITKSRPEAKLTSWESPSWSTIRLNQSRPAFTDPRVRRALFLALNYAELNDAGVGPGYWNYTGPLVSGYPGTWTSEQLSKMPGWDPSRKQQDITEAKALMSAAGKADGKIEFGILVIPPSGSDTAVRIKDQLERIWPAMKVAVDQPADGATFTRRQVGGDFDALSYGYVAVPDPILEGSIHYRTGNSRNYTKLSDAETDRLIDAASIEFDAGKRRALTDSLQKRLLEQMFMITTGKSKTVIARQSRVVGVDDVGGPGTFTIYDMDIFAKKFSIA